MYSLRWFEGITTREAVCANSNDAHAIYYTLKKKSERENSVPMEDYWIEIFCNGVPCNPERGGQLPPCREDEGPVFILKKGRLRDG